MRPDPPGKPKIPVLESPEILAIYPHYFLENNCYKLLNDCIVIDYRLLYFIK
jgi:hypothetical protein